MAIHQSTTGLPDGLIRAPPFYGYPHYAGEQGQPRWQVTPRNTRAETIRHGFNKQTVVHSRFTDMPFTTREKILCPLLLTIAETIPVHSHTP